jgi:hypothetical protein
VWSLCVNGGGRGGLSAWDQRCEVVHVIIVGEGPSVDCRCWSSGRVAYCQGHVRVHNSTREQSGSIRRDHLTHFRNHNVEFECVEDQARAEAVPFHANTLFGYDTGTGNMYLGDISARVNSTGGNPGFSNSVVRGSRTMKMPGRNEAEQLCFPLRSASAPPLASGFGMRVVRDENDRRLVEALLGLLKRSAMVRQEDILVCLPLLPIQLAHLRQLGAPVTPGTSAVVAEDSASEDDGM